MYLIAIADEKWGIAKEKKQIIYIPRDLKHFKSLTEGKCVVLGRKTLSSFPDKKPLKNRKNIILSRNENLDIEGAVIAHSVEKALSLIDEEAFIIGGETVYRAFLPYCSRAYITRVHYDFKADKFLPDLIKEGFILHEESKIHEFNGYYYSYQVYEKE